MDLERQPRPRPPPGLLRVWGGHRAPLAAHGVAGPWQPPFSVPPGVLLGQGPRTGEITRHLSSCGECLTERSVPWRVQASTRGRVSFFVAEYHRGSVTRAPTPRPPIHPWTLRLFPRLSYREGCCRETLMSLPLGKYPETGLAVFTLLTFRGPSVLLSTVAAPVCVPSGGARGSLLLRVLASTRRRPCC